MSSKQILHLIIASVIFSIASAYKIHMKPSNMPYLYPLWTLSVFLLIVSSFKASKKEIYEPYTWLVGLIISAYAYFCWKNYEKSKVLEATYSEPSTVIFICLLSWLFLETNISLIQIFAILIISFGLILPVFFTNDGSNLNFVMIFKHVFTNFLFSCINILYELKIKTGHQSMFDFLFTISFFLFFVTSIFLTVEHFILQRTGLSYMISSTNLIICVLETYTVLFGLSLIFILAPVARTLLRLVLSSFAGLYEGVFLINSIKFLDILSLFVVASGTVLYNHNFFYRLFYKKSPSDQSTDSEILKSAHLNVKKPQTTIKIDENLKFDSENITV
ncbi:Drug/Metabolite Transporter [Pseudoloma neurophilia]|uniref:Drug/Metabolite Transporter n=1 Tax=Pseudoloma neurophilia TaxID=146866 RepID=A0A0R0LY43_9MICR|nr:Drug/Metabolite Transporter [Pseudoloma neurophilia]